MVPPPNPLPHGPPLMISSIIACVLAFMLFSTLTMQMIVLVCLVCKSLCPAAVTHIAMNPWAPGDYENWEGTLIKLGGHNINLGGGRGGAGHQRSKLEI